MQASIRSVAEFGIKPDQQQVRTAELQKAIDTTSAAGQILYFPAGTYVSGTLHLRTNTTIELGAGAILQGSRDIADYPECGENFNPDAHLDLQRHHLLIAEDVENIIIRGQGTINGQGDAFWDPPAACEFFTARVQRPSPMLEFHRVKRLLLQDITITESPGWTVHVHRCAGVRINGIIIRNHLYGPNTDGLDITDSCDVFISDCDIVAGDDAIVLKSLGGINERIVITNCITYTNCSALKLGANESLGTIRQVTMSNCVVRNSSRGISLYCMGGGLFEDVSINNIVIECMNDIPLVCPIHINCSRNPSPRRDRGIGRIRNVRISQILCRSDARILLTAEDGSMLENIMLENVHMEMPEIEDRFEQARNAVGLQFSPFSPEARAAHACVAACNIKGLHLRNITTDWPQPAAVPMHFMWARNVEGTVDCPAATAAQPGTEKYNIENSRITIRD